MPRDYLQRLTLRIAAALGNWPEERRLREADYFLRQQQPDGGWRGREGGSDVYYTGFALRSLAVLGALRGVPAERAAAFLRAKLTGRETIVDFLSLLMSGALLDMSAGINIYAAADASWRDAVSNTLEQLRRPDGGYAKGMEGTLSSTYHSFLVLLCRELLERPIPEPQRLVGFLLAQRAEEGGFLEIRAQKRAGTNPTAAAIGALQMLDALTPEIREETIDFLAEMQTDEGGLRANTRIPIADLLSTFTGLVTLTDLEGLAELDLRGLKQFVKSLAQPAGGFSAAAWDPAGDVEYSFYGVGCMGLLGM